MPGTEHLFISDVHIGAFPEEKEAEVAKRLVSLIDYATENEAKLYILGDLFDYWMEYPEVGFIPEIGTEVLDRFEKYNKEVAPVLYITGNHDNWTFGHFKERGFDLEPAFRNLKIEDQNVLLMHGDGYPVSESEIIRPAFHRLLRNKVFIDLYQKLLPPKIGLNLMKKFSEFTRRRDHLDPKPLNRFAETTLKDKDLDIILSGHDHIPRTETFADGMYINLGTFYKHKTLVRYINNAFSLVTWHEDTKEFVPYGHNGSTL